MRKLALALVALAALCASARAQTLTTMFRFNYQDGGEYIWKPASDGQGNLYGTTQEGGTFRGGTLYRFTPGVARSFQTLHDFGDGTDGFGPAGGLTYDASAGVFYGMTNFGGVIGAACGEAAGCGTIFSFNPATGAYSTLYAFPGGAGGEVPTFDGPLTLGSDGALYGAVDQIEYPSPCAPHSACFIAFKLDPGTGLFTTLHISSNPEGFGAIGSLVFGKAGKLFGVMQYGGKNPGPGAGNGTVYRLDPVSGEVDVLYEFTKPVGPWGLTVDSDKNLYVTERLGGTNGTGAILKLTPNVGAPYSAAIVLSLDPYSNNVSGRDIRGALAFDSVKQVLYGAAYLGGAAHAGTLFQMNLDGSGFTVLHSFAGATDAGYPEDGVLISLGQLYGGTNGYHGEASHNPFPECQPNNGCGTLFKYPRF